MAHLKTCDGVPALAGALKKKKIQGVNHLSVTRIKSFRDPITREVVVFGPNEMYLMDRRDLKANPYTPAEQAQHTKWQQTCREALEIIRDPSHPRYMELYHRWRTQLKNKPDSILGKNRICKQFPNFVRAVLAKEV